jgi:hypothetical protein
MTIGDLGRDTIGALKGQPLLLVVVVLNVLMLGLIGFSVRTAQANNHAILQIALEKCGR